MKSALLFSRDPGGANTIIPLVAPLNRLGYTVNLYGKEIALKIYSDSGLSGRDIMSEIDNISSASVAEFLREASPDIVVTGTSAEDFTEKFLWKAGGELGIPSLAILDNWMNYGIRFSPYTPTDSSSYERHRSCPFLPSRIAVMDEHARNESISDGLPADRIVVSGQPYFERIFGMANDPEARSRLSAAHDINDDDFVVIFASQPIANDYGPAGDRWGYTEQTILSHLLAALETMAGKIQQRLVLIIRPHPRESREALDKISGGSGKVHSLFDDESDPWALMKRADLVCGMWSMFLIESVILGRPTLSIQIGLNRENPFIFDRRNILKSIRTERELRDRLREIIIDREKPEYSFEVIRNPVERIVAEMENMLCPSSP